MGHYDYVLFFQRHTQGYKDKVWAALPQGIREYQVKSANNAFESGIAQHKTWQGYLLAWKDMEKNFVPSQKFRKPSVDWRRQMERGTMHYGRWYEGPNGSDYRPGNTHDRLLDVKAPFTEAEWEERKQHRSFDLMKFGYMCPGLSGRESYDVLRFPALCDFLHLLLGFST